MTARISQSSPQVDGTRETGQKRATASDSRPAPVTGDRVIRVSAAIAVLAVAAFAAVVSYSHIYDLCRAHGQAGVAARLLPLSVDGLILAASRLVREDRSRVSSSSTRCSIALVLAAASLSHALASAAMRSF
jgi:Protein of unknown function (DUF2637)